MGNLVEAVTEKLRNLSVEDAIEIQEYLTAEKKKAIREAIRLADLYDDVEPKPFRIASGNLFRFPTHT